MSESNNKFKENVNNFYKRLGWPGILIIILAFVLGYFLAGPGEAPKEKPEQEEIAQKDEVETWTCSMHPQIKLPEPGQCPICFMDLIPLESTTDEVAPDQLQMSQTAMELAQVNTTKVQRGRAVREVNLSGKVTYDETRLKKITSWLPGRIERLYLDYTGMAVKKGDKLFEIYSPELIAAQEELIQIKKGLQNTEGTSSPYQQTKRTLEQVREKLRLLGLSKDQISQIEKTLKPSETVTITSPASGIVTAKDAIEGRYVNTGTVVYKIADLNEVWVNLDAYESDLQWLKNGQKVNINVGAFPGREFKGKVSFIDPILDSDTRSVNLRVEVENPDLVLKPGMFVRGTVESGLDAEGNVIPASKIDDKSLAKQNLPLIVPTSALLLTGKRAIAYVKLPNTQEPTFEFREVEIGPKTGQYYIVISGLEAGEEVVTRGNFKIDSAMEIAAKPSMMNPKVAAATIEEDGHAGHEMDHADMKKAPEDSKTAEQQYLEAGNQYFKSTLDSMYKNYFASQKALAQDNGERAKAALLKIHTLVNKTSASEFNLSEQALNKWEQLSASLMHKTHNLTSVESIDDIRKTFESVSKVVINVEQSFGHYSDQNHYQLYCPMAFNNKGAIWMQTDSSVNNPYFGSSMLKCGEVREKFTPQNVESKEAHDHE
jgi:Cu(I)/Ag(I) efflux system membrane fusion protein